MTGYRFVQACIEAGYNPEVDGTRVVSWFTNHVARKMAGLQAENHNEGKDGNQRVYGLWRAVGRHGQ